MSGGQPYRELFYITIRRICCAGNEKTKCSPRGERGAVAKAKPQKLFGYLVSSLLSAVGAEAWMACRIGSKVN